MESTCLCNLKPSSVKALPFCPCKLDGFMMQDLHEETVVHANSATLKTVAFSNRFPTISALPIVVLYVAEAWRQRINPFGGRDTEFKRIRWLFAREIRTSRERHASLMSCTERTVRAYCTLVSALRGKLNNNNNNKNKGVF